MFLSEDIKLTWHSITFYGFLHAGPVFLLRLLPNVYLFVFNVIGTFLVIANGGRKQLPLVHLLF